MKIKEFLLHSDRAKSAEELFYSMTRNVSSDKLNNYTDWNSHGWKPSFIAEENFSLDQLNLSL